jgi:hypothetical protein
MANGFSGVQLWQAVIGFVGWWGAGKQAEVVRRAVHFLIHIRTTLGNGGEAHASGRGRLARPMPSNPG